MNYAKVMLFFIILFDTFALRKSLKYSDSTEMTDISQSELKE